MREQVQNRERAEDKKSAHLQQETITRLVHFLPLRGGTVLRTDGCRSPFENVGSRPGSELKTFSSRAVRRRAQH
jgi:hypothetical protein